MSLEQLFITVSDYFAWACKNSTREVLTDEEMSKFSMNHFYYLESIYQLGTPTFSELSQKLSVTKPAVTTMVNKLEKQGYVAKTQSEQDKRVFYIHLTPKGQKIFTATQDIYQKFVGELKKHLSKEEIIQLESITLKITEIFQMGKNHSKNKEEN